MPQPSRPHVPARGKHRDRRRTRRHLLTGALGAVSVAAATVGVLTLTGGGDPAVAGCAAVSPLRVAADPAVAPVVRSLTRTDAALRCLRVTVSAEDPADVAAELAAGRRRPDVWIPDSSSWLSPSTRSATEARPAPSLATSPVVLAVPPRAVRTLASPLTYTALAATAVTPHPVRLRLADPARSAVSTTALVDLDGALRRTAVDRGLLTALLRGMQVSDARSNTPPARGSLVATAMSEQAVRDHNRAAGREVLRTVRPTAQGHVLDYPYVTLATGHATTAAARTVLSALRSRDGRDLLQDAGFRVGGPAGAAALSPRDSTAVRRTLALLQRPSRVLALIDVSGSMDAPVPGADGATRIALARTAIPAAIGMFSPGSQVGLWRFSTDLTPRTDYEQLLPIATLDRGSGPAFQAAVAGLSAVPFGGTGLYDSVLAAVREVRSSYDPSRVNSVVVLTDGRNEDARSVDLAHLLRTLRAETDPRRPVPVIAIAYGPDSDTAALRRVASATGGTVYVSRDPRDLPLIFHEAIGKRLCGDAC